MNSKEKRHPEELNNHYVPLSHMPFKSEKGQR